ncbi:MAG: NAD(+)/NADH kinase [Lachnospiraceae bacterium]|nr:NAD(+)/NADH kinase [Lachnospiraceae bacterium]
MDKFFIVLRDNHRDKLQLAQQIIKSIESKGGKCDYAVLGSSYDIADDTQCILAIGGDGTMIRAAQQSLELDIPILGINFGHMGYLCDLDKDSVFPALDRLFKDDYDIETRMMLNGYIAPTEDEAKHSSSLNDVIIKSCEDQHVTRLSVYVNDNYLFTYDCDGIIISTPTGSTAYNLSAHGPIVNPVTSLILLTPINPHTLNARSIVLDCNDVVSVKMIPKSIDADDKVLVSFDGRNRRYLRADEKLIVSMAKNRAKMVRLSSENFLDRIRNKMQE